MWAVLQCNALAMQDDDAGAPRGDPTQHTRVFGMSWYADFEFRGSAQVARTASGGVCTQTARFSTTPALQIVVRRNASFPLSFPCVTTVQKAFPPSEWHHTGGRLRVRSLTALTAGQPVRRQWPPTLSFCCNPAVTLAGSVSMHKWRGFASRGTASAMAAAARPASASTPSARQWKAVKDCEKAMTEQ